MKLVVGLGNPGIAYRNTRHNLGFVVADALSEHFKVKFKTDSRSRCLKARPAFKGEYFLLCKPLTYMNLSGEAVASLARAYNVGLRDILVICDDTSLELGRIRIKSRGSSGGHKGLVSIIKSLGSQEFTRLRIGIASSNDKESLSEYVLSRFSSSEQKRVLTSVRTAKESVMCWLENGTEEAMNRFNRLSVSSPGTCKSSVCRASGFFKS